ncbi:MAG: Translation elongation factor LepA, partial [uncultured Solirubrobacteraceae bacterium]
LPGPARRAREAHAQRRGAVVGARDLRRAGLRLPLRLPRPAAHGHRSRAARARVRPRADGDAAVGELRADADRRLGGRGPQPVRHARPGAHRRGPRGDRARVDPLPQGGHRPGHGALPGASSRARRHALPRAVARADPVRPAARRDRPRLLRPAQVAHPRLRLVRLRRDRHEGVGHGQARHPPRGRRRRRAVDGRAPREGVRARQGAHREAAREDPPPAVRRADPGGDRVAHHRPRDRQGLPQGRHRQVLRRRHLAQAQAARAPEGRQEAHEAGRPHRGPAGGVPRGARARRRGAREV